MSVLVTGGTGVLGYHLLGLFTKAKGELHAYSLSPPRPYRKQKHVQYFQGDILDERRLGGVLAETKPEIVYHLAAQNSVGLSQQKPLQTLQTNVLGTQILLESIRKTVPRARLVLVSTCELYGGGRGVVEKIHEETDRIIPMSAYATSKAACEMLARQYVAVHRLDIRVVRPFHFSGPRQSASYVLPAVAKQIADIHRNRGEFVIYAGNLDVSRDYVDVRDTARAIALVGSTGRTDEVYNICSGNARTIRDLVERLIEISGLPIEIRVHPGLERHVDIPMLVGSPEKIHRDTGWKPIISIEDSLCDLWAEIKTRPPSQTEKGGS